MNKLGRWRLSYLQEEEPHEIVSGGLKAKKKVNTL